jgi:putative pyruvate formate lyase activating enzyme
MSCVYCQNYEFSQLGNGREAGFEELAGFMLQLQAAGCHNINLVSPTHVMPQILKALCLAVPKGLRIPLIYNTSGYELPEMICLLDGIIDVYLADMRYAGEQEALKYSAAGDYPEYNRAAVKQMYLQVGGAEFDPQGLIQRGLIIRHLVLPEGISGTGAIMQFIAEEVSTDTYVSLMSQYLPCYKALEIKALSRRISLEEYALAEKTMYGFGLFNGWIQDSHGLEKFAGTNIKPNI